MTIDTSAAALKAAAKDLRAEAHGLASVGVRYRAANLLEALAAQAPAPVDGAELDAAEVMGDLGSGACDTATATRRICALFVKREATIRAEGERAGIEMAAKAVVTNLRAQELHYGEMVALGSASGGDYRAKAMFAGERDMTEGVVKGLQDALDAIRALASAPAPAAKPEPTVPPWTTMRAIMIRAAVLSGWAYVDDGGDEIVIDGPITNEAIEQAWREAQNPTWPGETEGTS